jgi:hypothetical protein
MRQKLSRRRNREKKRRKRRSLLKGCIDDRSPIIQMDTLKMTILINESLTRPRKRKERGRERGRRLIKLQLHILRKQ